MDTQQRLWDPGETASTECIIVWVLTMDLDIDGVYASKQRALISTRNREPAFN